MSDDARNLAEEIADELAAEITGGRPLNGAESKGWGHLADRWEARLRPALTQAREEGRAEALEDVRRIPPEGGKLLAAVAERDALARRVQELEQESEGYERSLQYAHADLDALLALGRAVAWGNGRVLEEFIPMDAVELQEDALGHILRTYDALPARLRERLEGENDAG